MIVDDGKNLIDMGNCIVESDALRVAQAINDYDEDLEVICLDPDAAGVKLTSAPFMVVQRVADGTYQKVMEAWTLDDRLLERIFNADQNRFNQLAQLEKMEQTIQQKKMARYREQLDQTKELSLAILKSNKSSYRFENEKGDLVRINESGKPSELNNNKKSL